MHHGSICPWFMRIRRSCLDAKLLLPSLLQALQVQTYLTPQNTTRPQGPSPPTMVALSDVQKANDLTFGQRPYVAVFVGATSGIGEHAIFELARHLSRNSDGQSLLYLIGRNTTEGDRIITECKAKCPGVGISWIRAQDLALLFDVDRICQEIRDHEKRRCADREPHIDLLFMTQGKVDFGGRSGTCQRQHTFLQTLAK